MATTKTVGKPGGRERGKIARARKIAAAPGMLRDVEETYLTLLQHPLDTWRIRNQAVLCRLRDRIAEATGRSSEDVQNDYESRAILRAIAMGASHEQAQRRDRGTFRSCRIKTTSVRGRSM